MATDRAKQPTIHDVAERAGVSKSLVSLVMRDSPNVSDEKRAAVLQAAEELGYRPNAVARSLVRQRTGVIGGVVADLHNPFFADVADGLEETAVNRGYRALLSSGFLEPEREAMAADTLLQLRVDGIIILGSLSSAKEVEKMVGDVPAVILGRASDSNGSLDSVRDDDEAGARLVVEHLIELGHRHIAHIDGGRMSGSDERRAAYEQTMHERGLGAEIRVAQGDHSEAGGARGMQELLAGRPPTAVFAPNDFAALGALDEIERAGLGVPVDISLVGYDNINIARLSRIGLTTIRQHSRRLGELAVELLLERIDEGRKEPRHVVVEPELIVRSSTAPPKR